MAKWKCDCGYGRELNSDGIVEACLSCGASEHNALRESIGVPEEDEVLSWFDEVASDKE